jgi:cobalt-zinc-cadmium efflux system outer membrane protein
MPFRRSAGVLALIVAGAVTRVASAQTPPAASPPAQGQPLTLQTALTRALEANPTIIAARFRRNVGEANLAVAGQHLNPELTYEAEKETPRQAIGASFPIEFGGKRGRRMDLARAGVDAANADIEATIAEVRSDVRRAYYELAAAAERVTMAEGTRALAARMRDAADARFTAGDVPRLDAVQTALVFLDADNEVTAAGGELAGARAELNALLGQPLDTPILAADTMTLLPVPSATDAIARAATTNSELVALDRHIAEQVARRDLARTLRTPDASAGGSVTYDAQPEFSVGWRVSFGFTLPLFTQHHEEFALEDAELSRLRAERAARASAIAGAVASAVARASAARAQVARFQAEILPRAVDVEQMAQDGYAAGQTSLSVLLQALQSARDTRRRGLEAALAFQLALADLERAIGAPLQ